MTARYIIPCGHFWSWQRDSNLRPAHYECAALPTELCQLLMHQLVHYTISDRNCQEFFLISFAQFVFCLSHMRQIRPKTDFCGLRAKALLLIHQSFFTDGQCISLYAARSSTKQPHCRQLPEERSSQPSHILRRSLYSSSQVRSSSSMRDILI